jgi:uncharacterized repeat protein (TIGR03833 family)
MLLIVHGVPDGHKRSDIKTGSIVRIVEKKNQKSGTITEGIVQRILTKAPEHPHGIMVELKNGAVGRVKEIIYSSATDTIASSPLSSVNVLDIIRKGECSEAEFKASFRFDLKKFNATGIRDRSKDVEKSVAKVLASFMNARGGFLLIGVSDDGNILGIEADLALMNKQNIDTFRLQLKNSVESYLNNKIIYEHLDMDFPIIDGKRICIIRITPCPEPIFVNDEGRQECYVRIDNESKPFDYDEFLNYWRRSRP